MPEHYSAWGLPGWLFNEFYDTLNLPDLMAI